MIVSDTKSNGTSRIPDRVSTQIHKSNKQLWYCDAESILSGAHALQAYVCIYTLTHVCMHVWIRVWIQLASLSILLQKPEINMAKYFSTVVSHSRMDQINLLSPRCIASSSWLVPRPATREAHGPWENQCPKKRDGTATAHEITEWSWR